MYNLYYNTRQIYKIPRRIIDIDSYHVQSGQIKEKKTNNCNEIKR